VTTGLEVCKDDIERPGWQIAQRPGVHYWLGSILPAPRASSNDLTQQQRPLWLWALGLLWAVFVFLMSLVRDDEGVEAARFGAVTSGQTVLYDEEGALRFSGGFTGQRRETGGNAGRASLVALLNHGTTERSWTSGFGCGLLSAAG
jgi:hypothetical protein